MMHMLSFKIDDHFVTPFNTGGKTVADVILLFINGAMAIAGITLLIFLIGAGIGIISSAGKGKPDDVAKSVKVATSALIGFLIVFASYLILQLIGNILVPSNPNIILEPPIT